MEGKVSKLVLFSFHFLRYTRDCVISALTLQWSEVGCLKQEVRRCQTVIKSVKVQKGRAYPTQRPFVYTNFANCRLEQ